MGRFWAMPTTGLPTRYTDRACQVGICICASPSSSFQSSGENSYYHYCCRSRYIDKIGADLNQGGSSGVCKVVPQGKPAGGAQ